MARWLSIDSADGELVITWRAERWQWRDILDAFKREFSRDAEFDPDAKCWRLPRGHYRAVRLWAGRFFERDEIRDHTTGEQPRPQPSQSSAVERAYRALWLVPGAPLWAAESVYRSAVKLVHPDAGGNHADAVAINRAIEVLRRVAS
jgi:hypothetical protein